MTDEAGRFRIDGLPAGKREFAFWHESAGWLGSDQFPTGRATIKLAAGSNDLGDLNINAGLLRRQQDVAMDADDAPTNEEPADRAKRKADHDERGFTPLHLAAMHGNRKDATQLLRDGADIEAPQRNHGGKPLQYAAAYGRAEFVILLLKHGARVDSTDHQTRTPLMWAADKGYLDTVGLLIAADANVSQQTRTAWTPLHYASQGGHEEIAQKLLNDRASVLMQTSQGATPYSLNADLEVTVPWKSLGQIDKGTQQE